MPRHEAALRCAQRSDESSRMGAALAQLCVRSTTPPVAKARRVVGTRQSRPCTTAEIPPLGGILTCVGITVAPSPQVLAGRRSRRLCLLDGVAHCEPSTCIAKCVPAVGYLTPVTCREAASENGGRRRLRFPDPCAPPSNPLSPDAGPARPPHAPSRPIWRPP